MTTDTAQPAAEASGSVEHLQIQDRIWLLRAMLLMSGLEERAMTLYRQGKVPRFVLRRLRTGGGLDRRSVRDGGRGPAVHLAPRPRSALVRGVTPARIVAQYIGRESGITRGREGNVHFGDCELGCVGMVSMLPDMMLVATGMAMAFKLRGEATLRDHVVRRRLDLAGRLPRGDELGRSAAAAGDLRAREQPVRVLDAARHAVRGRSGRARSQLRLRRRERRRQRRRGGVRNHPARSRTRAGGRRADADRGGHDADARTRGTRRHEVRANDSVEEWRARDPIERQEHAARRARRRRRGAAGRGSRGDRQGRCEEALASPMPDPARPSTASSATARPSRSATAWPLERIPDRDPPHLPPGDLGGLRDEMREDERVLMMGEDIGVFGGAFKVTDGFIASSAPIG